MSHLVAFATLDIVGIARLRATLRVVAGLVTVPADIFVDTLLGAMTSLMSLFLAEDAGDGSSMLFTLDRLLLAVLADMSKFCEILVHDHE
jgi:hypothetical protein